MSEPVEVHPPGEEPYRLVHALAGPRAWVDQHLPLQWRRRLAVFIGGMVGGAARIGVSALLGPDGAMPWGTLAANVTGALLLGYLLTRFLQAASRTTLTIPLLCTGALGAYTTFSTFSLEIWELLADGQVALGSGYAAGSVVAGLAGALVGIRLAEWRA